MTEETLLHRQVHPSFVKQGRVTSQAFRPTRKDDSRLSAYDGDQITPEAAWRHYTQELTEASVGVVSVAVRECCERQLRVDADPTEFAEHVVICFRAIPRAQ